MSLHRDALPQLGERLFVADGSRETTLSDHYGLELPSFGRVRPAEGRDAQRGSERLVRA
jgi:hypothetical protein